jgi:diguanylate cyclase (GGDEF)-like protein
VKTHHKIILILTIITLSLLGAKAYRDYLNLNATYQVITKKESESLANLYVIFFQAYKEAFSNDVKLLDEHTYKFLPVIKSTSVAKSFNKIDKSHRNIRLIFNNATEQSNLPSPKEKEGLDYFISNPKSQAYFRQVENQYLFMKPIRVLKSCLKCHGSHANRPEIMKALNKEWNFKENDLIGAVSIAGDNLEIKSSLIEDYVQTMAIYALVGFILLFGLSIIIKNAYKKDENYRKKLEKEVGSHVKTLENQAKLMHHQLFHDSLTGLSNRNQLIEDLSLLFFDGIALVNVDDFKHINDLYGLDAGDEVLISLGGMIKLFAKDYDAKVYKLHADEFAIGLKSIDEDSLEKFVNKLLDELKRFVVITDDDYNIDISATIGAALHEEDLLACADMALKRAKSERISYLLYNPSMKIKKEYAYNIEWTKKLKQAIKDDRIVPFYQGIYRCSDGKLEHYEVLMRCIDEDANPISPIHFLPIAKKNKLYHQLTRIVIEKALKDFANKKASISINLSIIDILDPKIVSFILDKIDSFDNPSRLSFEILESEGIENYQEVFDFIKKLKKRGCKIAIDDFGSGYSSFEHMLNLQVDLLKIDASLVKNIDTNKNARITTHAIVTFAKTIGVKTCAEYVHSETILALLKGMGVDYAQGYHLGKPLPFSKLKEL